MSGELLRLEGISKRFGDVTVLDGIELSVDKGEFVTLLGASGCGKTTTLRIIAGLEQPDSGRVYLDNKDVTGFPPNKRDVNTVFQSYALFPHMNVAANVGYSMRLRREPKSDIKQAVAAALELVRLPDYGKRMPSELSGGQRQRVAIARAIIARPQILLLDEPLGALDLKLRREMQAELKNLQKQLGIAFVYITHDQEEALNMSDRIAVMKDGRFVQVGTASDVYELPKTSYVASFVGDANLLDAVAQSEQDGVITLSRSDGVTTALSRGALVSPGVKLTLAVRSENVELIRDGHGGAPGGEEGLSAEVIGKSFTGGMLRITVRLDGGGELVASRHGIDSPLGTGCRVRAVWKPENAVVVDL